MQPEDILICKTLLPLIDGLENSLNELSCPVDPECLQGKDQSEIDPDKLCPLCRCWLNAVRLRESVEAVVRRQ